MPEFGRDLGQRRKRESAQMQSRVRRRQRQAVANFIDHRSVKEQQVYVYSASALRSQALATQTGLHIQTKSEQRKRIWQWRADSHGHVQKIGLGDIVNRLGLVY
jgi:hypothetical protein